MLNYFKASGWEQYPTSGNFFQQTLVHLQFREYQEILPLMPPLLQGQPPSHLFGLVIGEEAYIAKIWNVSGKINAYIGTLAKETYPESFLTSKLFLCQKGRFDINQILSNRSYTAITKPSFEQKSSIDAFCWNGEIAYVE